MDSLMMSKHILFTLAVLVGVTYAQSNGGTSRLLYNLPWIICPVITFILTIIGIIIGAYLIYRVKHHGAFACCSLRMRYKTTTYDEERADQQQESNDLPAYQPHPYPTTAPPNYQDALKDKVLNGSGNDNCSDDVPLIP